MTIDDFTDQFIEKTVGRTIRYIKFHPQDTEEAWQEGRVILYQLRNKIKNNKELNGKNLSNRNIYLVVRRDLMVYLNKANDMDNFNEDLQVKSDIEQIENRILCKELFKKLNKEEKKLVKLYFYDGLKYREISEKLKKPITTLNDQMKRILNKLGGK